MKLNCIGTSIVTAVCITFLVCSNKGTNGSEEPETYPWDFLPEDKSVGSWVKKDTSKYQIWEDAAHPGCDLNDFINGSNGKYLPFGFVRGTKMVYVNSFMDNATIDIYEFVNTDSAMALYSSISTETATTPISGLGDGACVDESGLFSSTIIAVYDRYYVEIAASKSNIAEAQSLVNHTFIKIDTYLNESDN